MGKSVAVFEWHIPAPSSIRMTYVYIGYIIHIVSARYTVAYECIWRYILEQCPSHFWEWHVFQDFQRFQSWSSSQRPETTTRWIRSEASSMATSTIKLILCLLTWQHRPQIPSAAGAAASRSIMEFKHIDVLTTYVCMDKVSLSVNDGWFRAEIWAHHVLPVKKTGQSTSTL